MSLLLPLLFCAEPALVVESAKPLPELTRKFEVKRGWTGGDGAASIPLSDRRTLWLFADTWIGTIENGRRKEMRLVNNTVAWQDLKRDGPLRYFWDENGPTPAAILRPAQPDCWYWPGDGALIDGKLYIFCKLVRRKPEGAPAFQFDWFGNELVQVANPQDEPTKWNVNRLRLSDGADQLRMGSCSVIDGDFLCVFGLFPQRQCKPLEAPLAVARVPVKKIARLDRDDWQYWRQGASGPEWSRKADNFIALFRDGGPELSVGRVRGIDGFVAVYQPLGIAKDIQLRHATRPEGPWSAPVTAYRCPEQGKDFVYAAKLHPELATRPGQLIITYCRNTGDLAEHVRRPDLYIPQGVEVLLKIAEK